MHTHPLIVYRIKVSSRWIKYRVNVLLSPSNNVEYVSNSPSKPCQDKKAFKDLAEYFSHQPRINQPSVKKRTQDKWLARNGLQKFKCGIPIGVMAFALPLGRLHTNEGYIGKHVCPHFDQNDKLIIQGKGRNGVSYNFSMSCFSSSALGRSLLLPSTRTWGEKRGQWVYGDRAGFMTISLCDSDFSAEPIPLGCPSP